ncbi:MAG: hypothetical protein AABX70_07385 [Nanoarchaeota archaeon]
MDLKTTANNGREALIEATVVSALFEALLRPENKNADPRAVYERQQEILRRHAFEPPETLEGVVKNLENAHIVVEDAKQRYGVNSSGDIKDANKLYEEMTLDDAPSELRIATNPFAIVLYVPQKSMGGSLGYRPRLSDQNAQPITVRTLEEAAKSIRAGQQPAKHAYFCAAVYMGQETEDYQAALRELMSLFSAGEPAHVRDTLREELKHLLDEYLPNRDIAHHLGETIGLGFQTGNYSAGLGEDQDSNCTAFVQYISKSVDVHALDDQPKTPEMQQANQKARQLASVRLLLEKFPHDAVKTIGEKLPVSLASIILPMTPEAATPAKSIKAAYRQLGRAAETVLRDDKLVERLAEYHNEACTAL